jgi:hypothetical protein
MRRQSWIWLGLSLAACGDGSSGNDLGTNIGSATPADAQPPALQSDGAATAQAQQTCVRFAALLCGKVTDCASTSGAVSDPDQPAALRACQADAEASLGCGAATYIGPGYPACEEAINANTCSDALSVANLPDECSGVIVTR